MGTHEDLKLIKACLGYRNTDLFGYECVVFIEGYSEDDAFLIIAKALGYDLTNEGIKLINIKGKGAAKKLREYLSYLKDSGVISYVILDVLVK